MTAQATEDPQQARGSAPFHARRTILCLGLVLVALVGANAVLRASLEQASKHIGSFYLIAYGQTVVDGLHASPFWKLLLPIPALSGSWCATSMVLFHFLEQRWAPASLYVVMNALFIVTTFGLSWAATRSVVFTVTAGLCAAFTTHNYHVYAVCGSTHLYFVTIYAQLLLFAQYKTMTAGDDRWRRWAGVSLVPLLLLALSYEGWLDLAVSCWMFTPLLLLFLRRTGRWDRWRRVAFLVGALTVTVVVHVTLKKTLGYGQVAGAESDVVFNYPSLTLAIEDALGHWVTLFYTGLTTFFPPQLVGSNSLRELGAERLIELQHGYHLEKSHLVPMGHLFQWRFHAGFWLALFLVTMAWLGHRVWTRPTTWALALFGFMLVVLLGSPTHALVKFRPMHSVPLLGYQVWFAVLGSFGLIAYALTLAHERLSRRTAWGITALVWLNLVACAFTRPPLLDHFARTVLDCTYPDPAVRARFLIDRFMGRPWAQRED